MTHWIEISLRVDGEAAEAVAELLQRYGHQGVSIEQDDLLPDRWDEDETPPPEKLTVRAFIPDDERADATKAQLETALGHMSLMYPMPQPVYNLVKETDWAEAWKAHYKPVRLGKRILIRPRWIEVEPEPDDVVIALDPGMAFGTGTHPTTQLCLEALEDHVSGQGRVLDLGCGSGILAIGAAMLGAKHVLGIDNDPVAVKAAAENLSENGVSERVTLQTGSLIDALEQKPFDLVVVNILAKVITAMCGEGLGQTVKPGGVALFSGVIDTQVDEVEAALRETGLTPTRRRQQGDWVLIEAKR